MFSRLTVQRPIVTDAVMSGAQVYFDLLLDALLSRSPYLAVDGEDQWVLKSNGVSQSTRR